MSGQPITPAMLDELIERCRHALGSVPPVDQPTQASILADLAAVRDHLVVAEQHDLGEWIRSLPPHQLGDFLADMEVTARQADTDSDIGSFISALADWKTTADAHRNGWTGD